MDARPSSSLVRAASRPTGAKMSTRSSSISSPVVMTQKRGGGAGIPGHTGQDALELRKRRSHSKAVRPDLKLTDCRFVAARTLLHDRQRPTDGAARFEEAKQHHAVCEVTDV